MKACRTIWGIGLLLSCLISQSGLACLYFDKSIALHSFDETDREALLFHDGDAANLILKTGFIGTLPKKLAWVFPVPSKPLAYKVTSPHVFRHLASIMTSAPRSKGKPMVKSVGGELTLGIKVHESERVGAYEIIPIEILSESSGVELNGWLKNQGFIESPKEIQTPYLKKGAFFLAIRASLKGFGSELQPLWIRYKSKSLSFPLRFTHEYRSFNSKVYFLTPKNTKITLPTGKGWDINDKNEELARVDVEYRMKDKSFDSFSGLVSNLIEFKDVRSVSEFLGRKDLKLAVISVKKVNSTTNAAVFRTKSLTNDPEVIL
jgi:hypothetical protein